eukprot:3936147-Rhodomonas_salina.1
MPQPRCSSGTARRDHQPEHARFGAQCRRRSLQRVLGALQRSRRLEGGESQFTGLWTSAEGRRTLRRQRVAWESMRTRLERSLGRRRAGLWIGRSGRAGWSPAAECSATPRNQTQEATIAVHFAPGMRFLV